MMRKQILRAREHLRNDLLEREKPQMSEQKLTFNVTYYPAFQNVRARMEELHLLLIPIKDYVPVIGFWNGKSLKDFLVTATLPIFNESGQVEPCGKKLVWSVTL